MASATERDRRLIAARASGARTLLKHAGVAVEEIDEHRWRVGPGYLFWPASGFWRRPDGSPGGGGAHALVEALKRAGEAPPEPPKAA